MRQAIGFLIILWGLSVFFDSAFSKLDHTATRSLELVEVAVEVAKEKLHESE